MNKFRTNEQMKKIINFKADILAWDPWPLIFQRFLYGFGSALYLSFFPEVRGGCETEAESM
jgi:hypothetical protein